jgi:hypothetical protein
LKIKDENLDTDLEQLLSCYDEKYKLKNELIKD